MRRLPVRIAAPNSDHPEEPVRDQSQQEPLTGHDDDYERGKENRLLTAQVEHELDARVDGRRDHRRRQTRRCVILNEDGGLCKAVVSNVVWLDGDMTGATYLVTD